VDVVGESDFELGEPERAQAGSDPWEASKFVLSVQIRAIKPESAGHQAR
jgi:hypothetical protein